MEKKRPQLKQLLQLVVFSVLLFALSASSLATFNVLLSDQGTGVIDKSSGQTVLEGNLTIEIYTAETGGSLIWSAEYRNGIKNGSWNVILGANESNTLNLNYLQLYYKDYLVNGEDVNFTNVTGGTVDRLEFISPVGPILSTNYPGNLGVSQDANVSGTLHTSNISSTTNLELRTGGTQRILVNNTQGAITLSSSAQATGTNSVSGGTSSIASGQNSFALGEGTTASGSGSIALGDGSIARGLISTAFGNDATAVGDYSTAMGASTNASGDYSTAIGLSTKASGSTSVAMGRSTEAEGDYSVALGRYINITPTADNTFAFGGSNSATDIVTQADSFIIGTGVRVGIGVMSPGAALDVEGDVNVTGAIEINGTHVCLEDGTNCIANEQNPWTNNSREVYVKSGFPDNVNVSGTLFASNVSSHSPLRLMTGGITRILVNDSNGAIAFSSSATSNGINSIAGGDFAIANGSESIAFGNSSKAYGDYSVAIGQRVQANSRRNIVIGYDTNASNTESLAIGIRSVATGQFSTALGRLSTASDTAALAIQGGTASGTTSTAIGSSSRAAGSQSIALGSFSDARQSNTLALGYISNASAVFSTAIAYHADALGESSLAIGYDARTNGEFAFAANRGANAVGGEAIAIGYMSNATGANSTAFGSNAFVSGEHSYHFAGPTTGETVTEDNKFVIGAGLNLGVGVASPTSALHVSGDGNFSGTIWASNVSSNSPLRLQTGGTTRIYLNDSSGGVSIVANAVASGTNSVALGLNSVANGTSATAFGDGSRAYGESSTAGGERSQALGFGSTVFGWQSNVTGNYGFAAGFRSVATGTATAIGSQSIANGSGSVSLGNANLASGIYAVALGNNNKALGGQSFTAGTGNLAGNVGTAIGQGNAANATWAIAMGQGSVADALSAAAIGSSNRATGQYSLATGQGTTASGDYSTALGRLTLARGAQSTAMGFQTNASGDRATATGRLTNASGDNSFATGNKTTASGQSSFAAGRGTIASDEGAAAFGVNTEAADQGAFAVGKNTEASGDAAFASGDGSIATAGDSTAMGQNAKTTGSDSFTWGSNSCSSASDDCRNAQTGVFAVYGGLCVGDTTECTAVADGDIEYDGSTSAYDLAEGFPTSHQVEKADVVIVLDNVSLGHTTTPYDTRVAGIISTAPNIVFNFDADGTGYSRIGGLEEFDVPSDQAPLSLAGRVPVKVCMENGEISVGDSITSSSTAGHAMRWSLLDPMDASSLEELKSMLSENEQRRNAVLGKALEAFDGSEAEYTNDAGESCGKIMALVSLQ